MRKWLWRGTVLALLTAGCSSGGGASEGEPQRVVSEGDSAEATVDARGAVLELSARARVDLPSGALEQPVDLRVETRQADGRLPRLDEGLEPASDLLVVTPHGLRLRETAEVEIALTDARAESDRLTVLRLEDEEDDSWEQVRGARVLEAEEERSDDRDLQGDESTVSKQRRVRFEVDTFSLFLVVKDVPVDGPCTGEDAGTVCRPAAGPCDVPEECDGESDQCPEDTLLEEGEVCRDSTDMCDVAETCDGESAQCPEDAVGQAGSVCRPQGDLCDVAETCDGESKTCPADALRQAGSECRPAAGPCDAAETCDGQTPTCPSDQLAGTQTVCRGVQGPCDVAETCSGESIDCPPDTFRASGFECNPAVGPCDVAETCTGEGPGCPADAVAPSGTECEPETACLLAASCDGSAVGCPAADAKAEGTPCEDGLFCTLGDSCNGAGTCTAGSDDPCLAQVGDGDGDCSESCVEGTSSFECTGADPDGDSCQNRPCSQGTCQAGTCADTLACPIFVSASQGADTASCGDDWGSAACASLEFATSRALETSNGRVFAQAGTYGDGKGTVLTMAPGVAYYGSFAGGESAPEQRKLAVVPAEPTATPDAAKSSVIDGRTSGKPLVVGAADARLDGFVVQAGSAGGMAAVGSATTLTNLTLSDVRFFQNSRYSATGGGLLASNVDGLALSRVAFDSASSSGEGSGFGGGMAVLASGAVTLSETRFFGNQAGGYSGSGGGLYAEDVGDLQLETVSFRQNAVYAYGRAASRGGAMASVKSQARLSNVTFQDNALTGELAYGGALSLTDGSGTLTNVQFLDNAINVSGAGTAAGGGLFSQVEALDVRDASFVSNGAYAGSAALRGGGAAVVGGEAGFTSVQFVDNQLAASNGQPDGPQGGGLYASDVTLRVQDSDFVRNEALLDLGETFGEGGGLYAGSAQRTGSLTLVNTGFVGNICGVSGDFGGGVQVGVDYQLTQATFYQNTTGLMVEGNGSTGSVYNGVHGNASGANLQAQSGGALPTSDFLCTNTPGGKNDVGIDDPSTELTLTASGHVYLRPGSRCADMGSDARADAAFGSIDWSTLTTRLDGTLDTSPVDAGRHFDAARQPVIVAFGPASEGLAWEVGGPTGDMDCLIFDSENTPSYAFGKEALPTGSLASSPFVGDIYLRCASGGRVAQARFVTPR